MTIATFIKKNEPNSELALKNSDYLMENNFLFTHPYDMEPCHEIVSFPKKIDWLHIPFGDEEWCFMLNRQEYLLDLCISYQGTLDKKYLLKGKELILDWISGNQQPKDWRTIDTGIRLVYWKIMLDELLKESILTTSELRLIEKSVVNQLYYLDKEYIEKYDLSNWGILISSGFFMIQLVFKNCVPISMNQKMLLRLENQLKLQIQPSGNHWEQSPLYFMEVLRSLVFLDVSKAIPDEKIQQQLEQKILLMYHYMPHFVTPEGTTILQGDTDCMIVDDMAQTIGILYNRPIPPLFTKRVSVDYATLLLSHETITYNEWKQGITRLTDKQFIKKMIDSYTGNIYYHSDWSDASDYFHLYNGSLGSGHGHLSLNHIDISMKGRNVFVDSGRFTYVESSIRKELKKSTHHNTLIANKQPFGKVKDSWSYDDVPTSMGVQHAETKDFVVSRSVYLDRQEGCIFKIYRTIMYFKRERDFLIIDQVIDLLGSSLNEMNRHFHLQPNCKVTKDANKLKIQQERTDIVTAYFSEATVDILETNYSRVYNQLESSKKIVTTSDKPHHFLYLTQKNDMTINKCAIRKSDGTSWDEDRCFGIEIKRKEITYLIHSAIEDTYKGHKLYFLNDLPVYGQLSSYKIDSQETTYERIL
ncbi:alginate lyase family protein [Vagococcus sp. DIV0080]|uniref:Alginate lyase family protein n=1 Tax=Candidatus Vagococcus giribetii TaxID=2230876 RepID=A0ABS3HVJ0_9ENTE|nr:heparinase II/III family protein [Vagococcus sp. DIV0080]MBO0477762.1 alginate lyase family protein [Vagococcus sp. DIV0080]